MFENRWLLIDGIIDSISLFNEIFVLHVVRVSPVDKYLAGCLVQVGQARGPVLRFLFCPCCVADEPARYFFFSFLHRVAR
jgi:hypothetical protein